MRLVAAMNDAVVIVDGQGDRFDAHLELSGRAPQCLTTDPHRPTRLYCGTFGDGLWSSDDAGDSWRPVSGLAHRHVTAVAVSPRECQNGFGTVYAGTEPSAVFRSEDGGRTWTDSPALAALPSMPTWSFPPRPQTHHVRWIAPDPNVPQCVFVAIEAGALVRSLDGGAAWLDRVPGGPYDTHTLVTTPLNPGHLYSAAGDGYFESEDGGSTWRRPQNGLEHQYLWSVAIDPRDPGLILVSAASSARVAHSASAAESYVYRREGTDDWEVLRDGLPPPKGTTIGVVAASDAESGVFYLVNNRGVYRSKDRGLSWDPLGIAWPTRFHIQRAASLIVL